MGGASEGGSQLHCMGVYIEAKDSQPLCRIESAYLQSSLVVSSQCIVFIHLCGSKSSGRDPNQQIGFSLAFSYTKEKCTPAIKF